MKEKEIIKEAEERYPEKEYPSSFVYRQSGFIEGAKWMMEDINYKELLKKYIKHVVKNMRFNLISYLADVHLEESGCTDEEILELKKLAVEVEKEL